MHASTLGDLPLPNALARTCSALGTRSVKPLNLLPLHQRSRLRLDCCFHHQRANTSRLLTKVPSMLPPRHPLRAHPNSCPIRTRPRVRLHAWCEHPFPCRLRPSHRPQCRPTGHRAHVHSCCFTGTLMHGRCSNGACWPRCSRSLSTGWPAFILGLVLWLHGKFAVSCL